MNPLSKILLIIIAIAALTSCSENKKNFICEFIDHSGKTSLSIKGDKAIFGMNTYPIKCPSTGNVVTYGANKESCEGYLGANVPEWFVINFDEIAGILVSIERSKSTVVRDKTEYECKKQ